MTITDRCADPEFQAFLARAHPRWWKSAERRGLDAFQTVQAVATQLCDGKLNGRHPEWRALVEAFERQKTAQVADECSTGDQM